MTLDSHTDATKLSVVLKKYIPSCKIGKRQKRFQKRVRARWNTNTHDIRYCLFDCCPQCNYMSLVVAGLSGNGFKGCRVFANDGRLCNGLGFGALGRRLLFTAAFRYLPVEASAIC